MVRNKKKKLLEQGKLKESPSFHKWISIHQKRPENRQEVLVLLPNRDILQAITSTCHYQNIENTSFDIGNRDEDVIEGKDIAYWMPWSQLNSILYPLPTKDIMTNEELRAQEKEFIKRAAKLFGKSLQEVEKLINEAEGKGEIIPLSNNSTLQIAEDMYGRYVVIEKESDGAVIINDKWIDKIESIHDVD